MDEKSWPEEELKDVKNYLYPMNSVINTNMTDDQHIIKIIKEGVTLSNTFFL